MAGTKPNGHKNKLVSMANPDSRKAILLGLGAGENVVFYGNPGESVQVLQKQITGLFKAGESMREHGLKQKSGMLVFEGELPTPVTRVFRPSEDAEES